MELKKILKFRNLWIGIAMLWIVFFHAGFWIMSEKLLTFKNMGYGGVDICLFASGIGCYFSLERDSDSLSFLKRRVKRLGPTYYCFIIGWLIWYQWVSSMPLQAVVGNLLGIQSLVSWNYHFNWYIGGLIVYYLSIPYLKQLTDAQSGVFKDIVIGLLLAAASVPFWGVSHLIVILSRMPVLYAGLVFAKLARRGYALKTGHVLTLLAAAALGTLLVLKFMKEYPDLLWPWGLYWYPFVLIVPGLCVALSLLAEKLENFRPLRWINRLLELIGKYSFELYLVHVFVFECLLPGQMERFSNIPINQLWAMSIPVVIAGTYLLKQVVFLLSRITVKQKA